MSYLIKDLIDVKAVIRGILISSTREITTIKDLERDYLRVEGVPVPFVYFGYPSVDVFLRSMPESVTVTQQEHSCHPNTFIVEAVMSEQSDHVRAMVLSQRKAKESEKTSSAFMKTQRQKRLFQRKIIPMNLRIALFRMFQYHSFRRLQLKVLEEQLSHHFTMAGWTKEGHFSWVKMCGFSSIEEMVEGLKYFGLITVTKINGVEWVDFFLNGERISHSVLADMKGTQDGVKKRFPDKGIKVMACHSSGDEWSDDDDDTDKAEFLISDKVKKNLMAVMSKHQNGLWCSDLPREYKEHTGVELNWYNMGFRSIIQMVSKLKSIIVYSRPTQTSDWVLFARKAKELVPLPKSCSGNERISVPSLYIEDVQQFLEDHPKGIERSKFLSTFKEKRRYDLPWPVLGFDTPKNFFRYLAEEGVVQLKYAGNVPMVYGIPLAERCVYCKYAKNQCSSGVPQHKGCDSGDVTQLTNLSVDPQKRDGNSTHTNASRQHPHGQPVCNIENGGPSVTTNWPRVASAGNSLPTQRPRNLFEYIKSKCAK